MDTGKFIVFAWVLKNPGDLIRGYKFVWGGGSLIKAIYQAWVAKGYSGCVKIEWRGTR